MSTKAGLAPITRVTIQDPNGNPIELGDKLSHFEWSSFINGGYNIKIVLYDYLYNRINELASSFYLKQSRKMPLQATFQIGWGNTTSGNLFTSKLPLFITQMVASGSNNSGELGIEAVDPASYILSSGRADGSARVGNLSSAIKSVVVDAVRNVTPNVIDILSKKPFKLHLDVSETIDSKNGLWYTMGMDPMTFIKSSLEWSSSITNSKSMWFITSGTSSELDDDNFSETQKSIERPSLLIKQWPEMLALLPKDRKELILNFNTATPAQNDIIDINFIGNNFISTSNIELRTSGISSTTGAFYDYKTSDKTIVNDENTPNKLKPKDLKIANKGDSILLSYAKPSASSGKKFVNHGVTSIKSIPEMNGGELGINYRDYIDGRARQSYLQTLNGLMRIKVRLIGWNLIDDSRMLGTTVIGLNWRDSNNDPYFLSGRWILYGFKHIISRNNWYTDLYLSRLDHD